MKKYWLYITMSLVATMTLALTACDTDGCSQQMPDVIPDEEDGGQTEEARTVTVTFDWSDMPEADPEGMCVYFYSAGSGNGNYRRFDFTGKTGGTVELKPGSYYVIAYNNDTELARMYGIDGFYSHTAYTRETTITEAMYGNTADTTAGTKVDETRTNGEERLVYSPDLLYGCSRNDVIITAEQTEQTVTLRPHQLVHEFNIEIRNVSNLSNVAAMTATVTGLSSELAFATETTGSEYVTMPVELVADGTTIKGRFYAFGRDWQGTTPNYLTLYVELNDGSKHVYGQGEELIEITEQMAGTAENKHHDLIIIEGLTMPITTPDGGGLLPDVDDWGTTDQEIII